jgi:hypothetical protein
VMFASAGLEVRLGVESHWRLQMQHVAYRVIGWSWSREGSARGAACDIVNVVPWRRVEMIRSGPWQALR